MFVVSIGIAVTLCIGVGTMFSVGLGDAARRISSPSSGSNFSNLKSAIADYEMSLEGFISRTDHSLSGTQATQHKLAEKALIAAARNYADCFAMKRVTNNIR